MRNTYIFSGIMTIISNFIVFFIIVTKITSYIYNKTFVTSLQKSCLFLLLRNEQFMNNK